ncbi:hypothetical protein JCM6882_009513 [Rhodosporidiobolus microsporus]
MSSIGLSTYYPFDAVVPAQLVLRLAEVNVASLAVASFLFSVVLTEARLYYRQAWADDGLFWRVGVVFLVLGCAIDLALFATAVGVGLRDLVHRTYSRDTMDAIYIATKVSLWSTGMISELFFVVRMYMVLPRYKVSAWILYFVTAAPFLCTFVFFLLYRFFDFKYGRYARIMDLTGGWCNVFLAFFTVVVLGWRIVLQRKKDNRPNDALTAIFRGAVGTSALIALTSGGAAIFSCFLSDPSIYLLSSFFWNIYPSTAAISTIFALHQRQALRQGVTTSSRSFRIRGGRGTGKAADLQLGQRSEHPSEWRGDKVSLGPRVCDLKPSKADRLHTRRDSQRGGEVSFHDVALDTQAFERCEPTRSRAGVWVHQESVVVVDNDGGEEGDDEEERRSRSEEEFV